MQTTPYFIKHRHELKPREIVRLNKGEVNAVKIRLKNDDLILICTTEIALSLLSEVGNPLDCEIQCLDD